MIHWEILPVLITFVGFIFWLFGREVTGFVQEVGFSSDQRLTPIIVVNSISYRVELDCGVCVGDKVKFSFVTLPLYGRTTVWLRDA